MHATLERLFSIDTRALAVARIASGVLLLFDAAHVIVHAELLFTAQRYISFANESIQWWSVHTIVPELWFFVATYVIQVVLAIFLILGYKTRFVTVASWLLVVSLHHATFLLIDAGVRQLKLLLFFAMFVPWGEQYSVDSRGRPAVPRLHTSVWSALLLGQVALLYLFSGLHKSGMLWKEGVALQLALTSPSHETVFSRLFLDVPYLSEMLSYAMPTLLFVSAVLLFSPVRTYAVRSVVLAIYVALHLGIALTMRVGTLPVVCLVFDVLFVAPFVWNRCESWMPFIRRQVTEARTKIPVISQWTRVFSWGLAGGIAVCILMWNIQNLQMRYTSYLEDHGRFFSGLMYTFGIDQRFSFFAPMETYKRFIPHAIATVDGVDTDVVASADTQSLRSPFLESRWFALFFHLVWYEDVRVEERAAQFFCEYTKAQSVALSYTLLRSDNTSEHIPIITRECDVSRGI